MFEEIQCAEVRRLLPSLLEGRLTEAEARQVGAHRRHCPECHQTFLATAARGILQAQLAFAPGGVARQGRGVLAKTWLWPAAPPLAQDAQPQAGPAALPAGPETLLAEARQRLQQGAYPVWRLLNPGPVYQRSMGAVRTRGSALGGHQSLRIAHLDAAWEQTGVDAPATVTRGPVITRDGEFLLEVSSPDPGLAGRRLVCTLAPEAEEEIRFETELRRLPDGSGWRGEFRVGGLPAPGDAAVALPEEYVKLYAVPPEPEGH